MYLLLILSLVQVIYGQVARLGNCKNIEAVQDFRPEAFVGTWYIIARNADMFDDQLKCLMGTHEYVKDGGYFNVIFTALNATNDAPIKLDINLKLIQPGTAEFIVSVKEKSGPVAFKLKAIELDYNNYTALWACEQRNGYCIRYAWILARQNNLSSELRKQALNAFIKNGLEINDIYFVDQNNCTYN